jgi:hypothetical protein
MMRTNRLLLVVLLSILVVLGTASCTAASYENPQKPIEMPALVGIWEVKYSKNRIDKLIINEDLNCKQIYENSDTGYSFETGWESCFLESLSNDRMYFHIIGGRYFAAGENVAELEGMGIPCPEDDPNCYSGNNPRFFYDPYSGNRVEMIKELMLILREDNDGKLILHHTWISRDRGFAVIGKDKEIFRKLSDNVIDN